MSLMDAFVVEELELAESAFDYFALEPNQFEVWLALRRDGCPGNGTPQNPLDAIAPIEPPGRLGHSARTTLDARN